MAYAYRELGGSIANKRAILPDRLCIQPAEFTNPKADEFRADNDSALCQKTANIPLAHAKRKYSQTAYSMISGG